MRIALHASGCPGVERSGLARVVRHTDALSGWPRILSWLGQPSCSNTCSLLNDRHPRPVNAYFFAAVDGVHTAHALVASHAKIKHSAGLV